jgi:hypothetical protein
LSCWAIADEQKCSINSDLAVGLICAITFVLRQDTCLVLPNTSWSFYGNNSWLVFWKVHHLGWGQKEILYRSKVWELLYYCSRSDCALSFRFDVWPNIVVFHNISVVSYEFESASWPSSLASTVGNVTIK